MNRFAKEKVMIAKVGEGKAELRYMANLKMIIHGIWDFLGSGRSLLPEN